MIDRFSPAVTVSDALDTRFSARAFLSKPVDAALLRDLVERAARAPSGGNVQPWKLVAIGGEALDRLRADVAERLRTSPTPDAEEYPIYPPQLGEPYRSNRFRIGEMMYELLGIGREDKSARRAWFSRNYAFFGAPVAVFCYVERSMGAAQWSDLGMYLQSLMLLLRENGLHSCPQECWSIYHSVVDRFVDAPAEQMLFCGLSIGYADPDAAVNRLRSERMPLEAFARFIGM